MRPRGGAWRRGGRGETPAVSHVDTPFKWGEGSPGPRSRRGFLIDFHKPAGMRTKTCTSEEGETLRKKQKNSNGSRGTRPPTGHSIQLRTGQKGSMRLSSILRRDEACTRRKDAMGLSGRPWEGMSRRTRPSGRVGNCISDRKVKSLER